MLIPQAVREEKGTRAGWRQSRKCGSFAGGSHDWGLGAFCISHRLPEECAAPRHGTLPCHVWTDWRDGLLSMMADRSNNVDHHSAPHPFCLLALPTHPSSQLLLISSCSCSGMDDGRLRLHAGMDPRPGISQVSPFQPWRSDSSGLAHPAGLLILAGVATNLHLQAAIPKGQSLETLFRERHRFHPHSSVKRLKAKGKGGFLNNASASLSRSHWESKAGKPSSGIRIQRWAVRDRQMLCLPRSRFIVGNKVL